ncbi:MAG: response regulator [Calditrichaeota bacterium]|nr:response regulator [Calditrichota bacterium]
MAISTKKSRTKDLSIQLVDYLADIIKNREQAFGLISEIEIFKSLDKADRYAELPAVYLNLERYIKKIDQLKVSDIKQLRGRVLNRFQQIRDYEDLALIFESSDKQEIHLLKHMLNCVINEVSAELSKSDKTITAVKSFLNKPGDNLPRSIPLIDAASRKRLDNDLKSILIELGSNLFLFLKEKTNAETAAKIYERAYQQVSSQFITLDSFPIVINVLPYESLDHSKISLLNINQSQRILQDKIHELQQTNEKLLDKNKRLVNTQKKLIKSKEEAQKANQLKSQLLANVSHELRTPMSSILGFSELLMSGIVPQEKIVEFATQINKNGSRLLNLINNFLDLSKIESGRTQLNKKWFKLNDINATVKSYIEEIIDKKPIKLTISVDSQLDRDIYTDKDKLLQILFNIAGNAAKFTLKGAIDIDYQLNGNFLTVTIADSGIGIESHDLKHIFEEFYQIHTGLEDVRGSGLGLSISRHLVELLGGKIDIKSEYGKGSRFHFTIDIEDTFRKKMKKQKQEVKTVLPNTEALISRQQKHFLIAEDESSVRYLLRNMLDGFDIEITTNGREAIESTQLRRPQLIILDIMMPEMNGEETVRYFRDIDDFKDTPIIALTAKALKGERERLLKLGFTDYLSKPVKKADLLKLIERYT